MSKYRVQRAVGDWAEGCISGLDAVCFPADRPVTVMGSHWWIVWEDAEPVAYAGLRVCQESFNQGLAFLCRAGVIPGHRGRGLQGRLIGARMAYARRLGIREVVTYVVPDNLASANSLVGCGFKLYRPEHRWGGSAAMYFRRSVERGAGSGESNGRARAEALSRGGDCVGKGENT